MSSLSDVNEEFSSDLSQSERNRSRFGSACCSQLRFSIFTEKILRQVLRILH